MCAILSAKDKKIIITSFHCTTFWVPQRNNLKLVFLLEALTEEAHTQFTHSGSVSFFYKMKNCIFIFLTFSVQEDYVLT